MYDGSSFGESNKMPDISSPENKKNTYIGANAEKANLIITVAEKATFLCIDRAKFQQILSDTI